MEIGLLRRSNCGLGVYSKAEIGAFVNGVGYIEDGEVYFWKGEGVSQTFSL